MVPPPQIQTVKKTTSRVVENIICRAYVAVSLMDRAKVMAPRRPAEEEGGGGERLTKKPTTTKKKQEATILLNSSDIRECRH